MYSTVHIMLNVYNYECTCTCMKLTHACTVHVHCNCLFATFLVFYYLAV